MVTTRAEQWTVPVAYHGEGPAWDDDLSALRCVDMLAGDVLTVRDGQLVDRENFGAIAAAWRPRRQGGFVVAVERGFVLVGTDGRREHVGPLWDDSDLRMNEGGCAPDGSFYSGSMEHDAEPGRGSLWRLAPDGSCSVVLDDVTISNGLAFAADGRQAYFIDTPTHRVDVLTFSAPGVVAHRQMFVDLRAVPGQPDGLALDAAGGVWVAMWGAGQVRRFDSEGQLTDVVSVGVMQVSAVAFGGPAFEDLFITTSRFALPDGDEPQAGSVFVARVGVRGAPVPGFAG
jgi:sugar lactone lactonase YvrE